MSARVALMLAAAGLATAACGTSPRDAVRQKVQQFADAARSHDYKTICTQVLAPSLAARADSAGLSCEQAMAIALGSVRRPVLSVGQVTVKGNSASAIVLSVAVGQQASLDTMELVHTGHGWRISALQR